VAKNAGFYNENDLMVKFICFSAFGRYVFITPSSIVTAFPPTQTSEGVAS
jgi:hypothetical protein